MDFNSLEKNLQCPICWTIPENPYESTCCGHIFCSECTYKVSKTKCALCRSSDISFRPNTFAKLLLKEVEIKCIYGCDKMVTFTNMNKHRYHCSNGEFKCKIDNCQFTGLRDDALNHMANEHPELLIILSEHYNEISDKIDKLDESKCSNKFGFNNNMRNLNKKLNEYKSDISDFYDCAFDDSIEDEMMWV